jgi:hypothetical protein
MQSWDWMSGPSGEFALNDDPLKGGNEHPSLHLSALDPQAVHAQSQHAADSAFETDPFNLMTPSAYDPFEGKPGHGAVPRAARKITLFLHIAFLHYSMHRHHSAWQLAPLWCMRVLCALRRPTSHGPAALRDPLCTFPLRPPRPAERAETGG